MSDDRPAIGVRPMEAVTALLLAGVGALAVWDSRRLGAGWGADGPQSGYFPFWLGLMLMVAGLGLLAVALRPPKAGPGDGSQASAEPFLTHGQLRHVLAVLLPLVVYVAAIPFLGLYVASAVFVAYFLVAVGRFPLLIAIPSGLAVGLVAFVVFDLWFLVALPKGPVEDWLGY